MRGKWTPTRARPEACLERQSWREREAQTSSVGGWNGVQQEAEQGAAAPAAEGGHEAGGAGGGAAGAVTSAPGNRWSSRPAAALR